MKVKTGYERSLRVIDTVMGLVGLLGAAAGFATILTTGKPLLAGFCGVTFTLGMGFGLSNLFSGLFGEDGLLKRRLRREIARFRLYSRRGMVSAMAFEYAAVIVLPALLVAKLAGAF